MRVAAAKPEAGKTGAATWAAGTVAPPRAAAEARADIPFLSTFDGMGTLVTSELADWSMLFWVSCEPSAPSLILGERTLLEEAAAAVEPEEAATTAESDSN